PRGCPAGVLPHVSPLYHWGLQVDDGHLRRGFPGRELGAVPVLLFVGSAERRRVQVVSRGHWGGRECLRDPAALPCEFVGGLHDVAGRRGSGRPVPRKFLAHAPHRLVESLQCAPIFGRYDDRRGRGLGVLGLPFPHGEEPGQKGYYDWMGYVFLFITMAALIPMPFAGYWLMRSVYEFRQQLGVTMMGGMLTWMFVLQAIAVGALFIGANYYLWQGMARMPGSERYHRYIKYILYGLVLSFLVWFTPHTLVLTSEEAKDIGGSQHPVIGNYGDMSAKNGAINTMILLSALSYIFYQRANK